MAKGESPIQPRPQTRSRRFRYHAASAGGRTGRKPIVVWRPPAEWGARTAPRKAEQGRKNMAAELMRNLIWVALGTGMILVLTLIEAILRELTNRYTHRVVGYKPGTGM